jgi:glycine cleavage system H protein
MSKLRYTDSHEWVRLDGNVATIGITDFAQKQLGDVVYVELPENGRVVPAGKEAAVVESVKAASEVYAPLAGTIAEGNTALSDDPGLVNRDPLGDGWFFKLTVDDPVAFDGLLDEAAYMKLVEGQH